MHAERDARKSATTLPCTKGRRDVLRFATRCSALPRTAGLPLGGRAVGTPAGARALLLRMQPAGLRPHVVHRAAPRGRVQEMAIPARPPRHREHHVLVVEMVDQARLLQALRDVPRLLVLRLERIHQPEPHQIGQLHLERHRAAVGRAGGAQARAVAGPGGGVVDIDDGNGGAHGWAIVPVAVRVRLVGDFRAYWGILPASQTACLDRLPQARLTYAAPGHACAP